MGGVSFTFNPDELFTRAKNQSSTPTVSYVLHRTNTAHCPEGYLPQMGAEIKAIGWAPQVYLTLHCADCVRTVISRLRAVSMTCC